MIKVCEHGFQFSLSNNFDLRFTPEEKYDLTPLGGFLASFFPLTVKK